MKELILSNDAYRMNWIDGTVEWGTVKSIDEIKVKVESRRTGDLVEEKYTFINISDRDVFTSLTDIGIYTPFNDDYVDAQTCLKHRCHTHIWCGQNVSYIMAMRMGGEAPNLGLVLTKGSLSGYSVERDLTKMSNDRGDFILHPTPFSLAPGESYSVEWTLFPFSSKEDFFKQANKHCGHFVRIEADRYVIFKGESINVVITPEFVYNRDSVRIFENNVQIQPEYAGDGIIIKKQADTVGELRYDIYIDGVRTYCCLLVQPEFTELVRARCHFIVNKQQYNNPKSHLDGDYLIYDNEEMHMMYSPKNDYNAGRERVGMGIMLAKYLQNYEDDTVDKSLRKYISFVRRELVNEDTGEVYNDYMNDNSYKRLYNAPWFALFYTELYMLYKDKKYLMVSYRIIRHFYEDGGTYFYAIELPVIPMAAAFREAGMEKELEEVTGYFRGHADLMLKTGTDYPKSEVNYEQSIVAPATQILEETYILTGDKKYLAGIELQKSILELFNGNQPDYHLNEVAIRHWDGYWFGKRRLYGDTFVHYWSALTGIVFENYMKITGNTDYAARADKSLRAVLSMFYPDGRATCAFVYPVTVNGERAHYADSYANDQDWGLYYAMRYLQ